MEVSDVDLKKITTRILLSRMRLLHSNGFFGLLLMYMKLSLADHNETAWTDCKDKIWFNPEFVKSLTDKELDYVLMHEIMHVVLKHSERVDLRDRELFNIAADIVVNSNIMHANSDSPDSISLKEFGGEQMHLTPDGNEGWMHTVEEVYLMIDSKQSNKKQSKKGWDTHVDAPDDEEDYISRAVWQGRINRAAKLIEQAGWSAGCVPAFEERALLELKQPKTDWRIILNDFLQEEVNDYSFTPPDHRYCDLPFFLPDFNEKDHVPGKILFMIDTSASMSDEEITTCYSEIKGAIEQFDGKLTGWLGFFDAEVVEPIPFSDVEEFLIIHPKGGGGTSFNAIFDYVAKNLMTNDEDIPTSIVILTDGYASFPEEKSSVGIPTLWIINNYDIEPPWGRVARI